MGEVPVQGEFPAAIALRVLPQYVEPDKSYPADLTTLLDQRYMAQRASRVDAFTVNLSDDSNQDCNPNPPHERHWVLWSSTPGASAHRPTIR
jgi:hypothetical protein